MILSSANCAWTDVGFDIHIRQYTGRAAVSEPRNRAPSASHHRTSAGSMLPAGGMYPSLDLFGVSSGLNRSLASRYLPLAIYDLAKISDADSRSSIGVS